MTTRNASSCTPLIGPTTPDEERALADLTDALAFASEPRTLKEIGERLGYSRERIRQIQNGALGKLAAMLRLQSNADVRTDWLG